MSYAAKAKSVIAKIAAKGMPMILVRRVKDYNQIPQAGQDYPCIEARQEIYGVRRTATKDEIQAGLFAPAETVLVFSAQAQGLTNSDLIFCDGKEYAVRRVEEVSPAGVPVLVKVAVKEHGEADTWK